MLDPRTDEAAAVLVEDLKALYGAPSEDIAVACAPYRACPLGAHVDHQGGAVTGVALDRALLLAFAPAAGDRVRLSSRDFPGEIAFDLGDIPPPRKGCWGNYARGAALALRLRHRVRRGLDGVVRGDLPVGGVASSAALGIDCLLALERVNALEPPAAENIELDREIENGYIGLRNGILDQSVILLARRDELLHSDCSTLARESVPFGGDPTRLAILVVHSGVERSLIGTPYNRHVEECGEAAAALLAAAGLPVPPSPRLSLVPASAHEAHAGRLSPALRGRAEHFFAEAARVREGVAAWRAGELDRFGALVTESGRSSIENYRSGCPELVTLWETLRGLEGVHGVRFSGAGYGGCAVALVEPERAEDIAARAEEAYEAAHPESAGRFRTIFCRTAGGASIL